MYKLVIVLLALVCSYSLTTAQVASESAPSPSSESAASSAVIVAVSPTAATVLISSAPPASLLSPSQTPASGTVINFPVTITTAATALTSNPSANPSPTGSTASIAATATLITSESTAASVALSPSSASTAASSESTAASLASSASTAVSSESTAASVASSASTAASSESTAASVASSASTAASVAFNVSSASSSAGPPSTVYSALPPNASTVASAAASTNPTASAVASSPNPSPSAAASSESSYDCYCTFAQVPTLNGEQVYNLTVGAPGGPAAYGALGYGNAVSNTLNYLAVGAPLVNNGSGSVDIFTRFANFPFWTYRTTIFGRGLPNYSFGQNVFILQDASVVVLEGVSNNYTLYSFERSGPASWIQVVPPFTLNISRIASMQAVGSLLVVATRASPIAVDIYNKIGYQWTHVTRIPSPEGSRIPYLQVAIGAGNRFVASTGSTSVHLFRKDNLGNWNLSVIQPGVGPIYAIALSTDRQTLALSSGTQISLITAVGGTFPDASQAVNISSFPITNSDGSSTLTRFGNLNFLSVQGPFLVATDLSQQPSSIPQSPCSPTATTGAAFVWSRAGTATTPISALRPASRDDGFGKSASFNNLQGNILVVGGTRSDNVYTFIEQPDVALTPCASESAAPSSESSATQSPAGGFFPSSNGGGDRRMQSL